MAHPSKLKYGLFLTIGHYRDAPGKVLAVISDGTPTEGHEDTSVLAVSLFEAEADARLWFKEWECSYLSPDGLH